MRRSERIQNKQSSELATMADDNKLDLSLSLSCGASSAEAKSKNTISINNPPRRSNVASPSAAKGKEIATMAEDDHVHDLSLGLSLGTSSANLNNPPPRRNIASPGAAENQDPGAKKRFQKKLTQSDIKMDRLILHKKDFQECIAPILPKSLNLNAKIPVTARCEGGGRKFEMMFDIVKQLPQLNRGWNEFRDRYSLQEGDTINMFMAWNSRSNNLSLEISGVAENQDSGERKRFHKELTNTDVTTSRLILRKKHFQECIAPILPEGLNFDERIPVTARHEGSGEEFEMELEFVQEIPHLCNGWKNFRRSHELQKGDTINMFMSWNSQSNRLSLEISWDRLTAEAGPSGSGRKRARRN